MVVIFELGTKSSRTKFAKISIIMEVIDQQLVDLLEDCARNGLTKTQVLEIFETKSKEKRCRKWKTLTVLLSLCCVMVFLTQKCETFSWTLSAFGRLALIKILPFWDWTPLYNRKCLIPKKIKQSMSESQSTVLGRFETEAENCVLCETVDYIASISNVTFSQLETIYLERGLPVIVTDSHSPQQLTDLLVTLQNEAEDFLDSQPCDLATNIMLKKLFNLEVALQKIKQGQVTEKWFLQLRNCQFKAVKASRVFVTRPYYYPLHMEPFYTSWLLISHNYNFQLQRLYLKGLIFVQQLSSAFNIQLQPKQPCNETCTVFNIKLKAGECLIFSTDLWVFHYSSEINNANETALATILEIDWQI